MVQSTSTLNKVANDCLVQIGERPSRTLTNMPGRKATLALEAALEDINLLNDWTFQRVTRPVTTWTGGVGKLDNFERIFVVRHLMYELVYVEPAKLDALKEGQVFLGPRYWTLRDESTIEVFPAPKDEQEQQEIEVYGTVSLLPPQRDTDPFPIPERLIPLLRTRAVYYLAISHLDDTNLAQAKDNEFRAKAARYLQRERSRGVGTLNMYRRRH